MLSTTHCHTIFPTRLKLHKADQTSPTHFMERSEISKNVFRMYSKGQLFKKRFWNNITIWRIDFHVIVFFSCFFFSPLFLGGVGGGNGLFSVVRRFFCLKCITVETGFLVFARRNINGNPCLHNNRVINSSPLTPLILNLFFLISTPSPMNFPNQNPSNYFPTFFPLSKELRESKY